MMSRWRGKWLGVSELQPQHDSAYFPGAPRALPCPAAPLDLGVVGVQPEHQQVHLWAEPTCSYCKRQWSELHMAITNRRAGRHHTRNDDTDSSGSAVGPGLNKQAIPGPRQIADFWAVCSQRRWLLVTIIHSWPWLASVDGDSS